MSTETICTSTGLSLVPAHGQVGFRIAKTSYGPMNPPVRSPRSGAHAQWGRFDVAGGRTIYVASTEECAYSESLAFARPSLADIDLTDLFDGELDDATLEDIVSQEWSDAGFMKPGHVPAGWRRERLIHEMELPASGWFVAIEHPETIAAITTNLATALAMAGLTNLTTEHLHGENRALTTTISAWLRSRNLFDGSLPHGIMYSSKHGANWDCWAIWLRALDDDKELSSEPTSASPGREIKKPQQNDPLRAVCGNFNLTCF